jgi:mono/diheme cytochrome c family protein
MTKNIETKKIENNLQSDVALSSLIGPQGQLSREQLAAVAAFIREVGGVDNAQQALAVLTHFEELQKTERAA